jgi:uncharacterized membrane-anchored protein
MFSVKTFVLAASAFALLALPAQRAGAADRKINILKGPAMAQLESIAHINLPEGYIFLDGKTTRALMKAEGEPVSGSELGLIRATNQDWSVMFEFSDIGYVKDADKAELDPDKILADIKRGTAAANKQRIAAGRPALEIVGWEVPPKYDPESHNLEWAIRATSAGEPILNYNTRLLGRKGVMEVVLIVEPDKLAGSLPTFRNLLAGYSFQTGHNYAEYRPGDKVAKYGLAALIVGGAAVGAAKMGLFTGLLIFLKKGWKLVVVAIAAVVAAIKRFFARLFGGRQQKVQ